MSEYLTPYAGSERAHPDGFNDGVDFALEVIRERIRHWERRRKGWREGPAKRVYDNPPGVIETELVRIKERILANRRAG